MATREQIEAGAEAIYPLLQDIINNRPLKNKLDMPEFQLAQAALEAAEAVAWQPIETAPKDAPILAHSREGHYGVGCLLEWDAGYWTDGVMPLTESEFIEQFDRWRLLPPIAPSSPASE